MDDFSQDVGHRRRLRELAVLSDALSNLSLQGRLASMEIIEWIRVLLRRHVAYACTASLSETDLAMHRLCSLVCVKLSSGSDSMRCRCPRMTLPPPPPWPVGDEERVRGYYVRLLRIGAKETAELPGVEKKWSQQLVQLPQHSNTRVVNLFQSLIAPFGSQSSQSTAQFCSICHFDASI